MEEMEATVNYKQIGFEITEDGRCIFYVKGELDHHSVIEIREIIDSKLVDYRPVRVIMDLNEVTFTDSAGLGLVLGRYTRISAYGGDLTLINVPEPFMKILRLSGAEKLFKIIPKGRQ
jgi:stage II sporulation protein AA (anti-sigma F factor antagonist)